MTSNEQNNILEDRYDELDKGFLEKLQNWGYLKFCSDLDENQSWVVLIDSKQVQIDKISVFPSRQSAVARLASAMNKAGAALSSTLFFNMMEEERKTNPIAYDQTKHSIASSTIRQLRPLWKEDHVEIITLKQFIERQQTAEVSAVVASNG